MTYRAYKQILDGDIHSHCIEKCEDTLSQYQSRGRVAGHIVFSVDINWENHTKKSIKSELTPPNEANA